MSASKDQSTLNSTSRGAGTTWGPNDINDSSTATPGTSAGSATAAGHGDHPRDNADDSNASLPNSKVGPQKEDLDGEQMRAPGEGEVMDAQFNKKNAGWGEQESLTDGLEGKKEAQSEQREAIQAQRKAGKDIDGGAVNRTENESMSQAG